MVDTRYRLTTSVAMATYNGSEYIIEQLESIENQTVKPDEVIICDDCSVDDTVELVMDYSKNSSLRIAIIQNKTNLGFRKNYEKCISLCTSDIIFYCDQDDVWLNTKIEKFLNEFSKDSNLVYAFSNAYVTDSNLDVIKESEWQYDWLKLNTRQAFFDYVQTRNFPLGFQSAFKKEFVKQIIPFLVDPDGWIAECAPIFGTIKAIPDKLVFYRRHNKTTSEAHKANKKSSTRINLLKRVTRTKYQVFFTYPHAERTVYSKIKEYINNTKSLSSEAIDTHLWYLAKVDEAQQKNILNRICTLRELKKSGSYYKYRGNNHTYYVDLLFMILNSFKKNK